MKNIFYIFLELILVGFFMACNPITEDGSSAEIITVDQFEATVTPVQLDGKNTNMVLCETSSPVTCHWTDGVKTYVGNSVEMTLFVTGQQTITVTAMNQDGSTFTKDYTITVEDMAYEVDPQYGYFCGTGTKVWTWKSEKCFGNGSNAESGPAWWVLNPSDVTDQCTAKGFTADGSGAYMTFTLKGLEMTKTSADGTKTSGTFSFDMSTNTANGWSYGIGVLTLSNTNILCGHDLNDADYSAWSSYNIVSLDDETMVLGAQEFDGDGWWYWVFKAE
ncbi:MAG: hypothetical protein H6Q13_1407 [Bacteroidetes bacterium]|jgi:hypothetical protein|nr:hypothetical protein [Bacteroidota bacterium]